MGGCSPVDSLLAVGRHQVVFLLVVQSQVLLEQIPRIVVLVLESQLKVLLEKCASPRPVLVLGEHLREELGVVVVEVFVDRVLTQHSQGSAMHVVDDVLLVVHELQDVGQLGLDDLVVLLLDQVLPAEDAVVPLQRLLLLLQVGELLLVTGLIFMLVLILKLVVVDYVAVVEQDLLNAPWSGLLRTVLVRLRLPAQLLFERVDVLLLLDLVVVDQN